MEWGISKEQKMMVLYIILARIIASLLRMAQRECTQEIVVGEVWEP